MHERPPPPPERAWRGNTYTVWTGSLKGDPPAHLMAGLFTALTSTEPLTRRWHERVWTSDTRPDRPRRTGEAVAAGHRARVERIQAVSRKVRRKNPPHTASPTAPPRTLSR